MEVTIKFLNGTHITAELNGNCLITDEKPAFPDDLRTVIVESEGITMEYHYAQVSECASIDGRYWFVFTEMSQEERRTRQMQANIEYIAMMTDVELEDE